MNKLIRLLVLVLIASAPLAEAKKGPISPPQSPITIGTAFAYAKHGSTVVRWETGETLVTAGFYLERLDNKKWKKVSGLIKTPMFGTVPIVYEVVDSGAKPGKTYQWRLVELDFNSATHVYGPYQLFVDPAAKTYAIWAEAHFTPEELADPDGDGLSNWQEYLLGTYPTLKDSVLQPTSISQVPSGVEIKWKSIKDRFYHVAVAKNLLGPYLPIGQPVLANNENGSTIVPIDLGESQLHFIVIEDGIGD
jgi:hypothetical protein